MTRCLSTALPSTGVAVGEDRVLKSFLTTSAGEHVANCVPRARQAPASSSPAREPIFREADASLVG